MEKLKKLCCTTQVNVLESSNLIFLKDFNPNKFRKVRIKITKLHKLMLIYLLAPMFHRVSKKGFVLYDRILFRHF